METCQKDIKAIYKEFPLAKSRKILRVKVMGRIDFYPMNKVEIMSVYYTGHKAW